MRFLVKVSMPTDAGNRAVSEAEFGHKMQTILQDIKAEASYFTTMDGRRTALIIVNVAEASQIPSIGEPFYQWLGAEVDFHPVMMPEDLGKAGPNIEAAVKKWGKR